MAQGRAESCVKGDVSAAGEMKQACSESNLYWTFGEHGGHNSQQRSPAVLEKEHLSELRLWFSRQRTEERAPEEKPLCRHKIPKRFYNDDKGMEGQSNSCEREGELNISMKEVLVSLDTTEWSCWLVLTPLNTSIAAY